MIIVARSVVVGVVVEEGIFLVRKGGSLGKGMSYGLVDGWDWLQLLLVGN